ncbi:PAS domain-containing protein [Fragilaria crotonensis]|nr:PAS domain-containing protein [Fragilaria crotonensis]
MISAVAKSALRNGKKASGFRSFTAWSGELSFSSPEADFYHTTIHREGESPAQAWSRSFSYASPEADFSYVVTSGASISSSQHKEWSGNFSFVSPEADVTSYPDADTEWEWTQQLTFASPESDFQNASSELAFQDEWSERLSFASPESDFQMQALFVASPTQEIIQDYSSELNASEVMRLAISSPESALGSLHAHHLLRADQLYQLHESRNERISNQEPLPQTLHDALSDEHRAIVITEAHAPFRIVDVNDAWVGLCGYTKEEARQRSLAMLHGPETNVAALRAMEEQLVHAADKEATAHVVNYTKVGRKFYNQLRAGPLYDANGSITHFVGVLQEVFQEPEYFHVAHA